MVLKTKEIAYVNYSAGSRNPVEAFKRKSGIACVYVCVCVCVCFCVCVLKIILGDFPGGAVD